jgi:hypothetical protein
MSSRSQQHDARAIAHHYDVSNEFYTLFLDPLMVYTCAYYREPDGKLEQAQEDKLDLVCRKLRLKRGETMLDIGCGWGSLSVWAAQHYDVRAHGVTLSRAQAEWAQQRIKRKGSRAVACRVSRLARSSRRRAVRQIAAIGIIGTWDPELSGVLRPHPFHAERRRVLSEPRDPSRVSLEAHDADGLPPQRLPERGSVRPPRPSPRWSARDGGQDVENLRLHCAHMPALGGCLRAARMRRAPSSGERIYRTWLLADVLVRCLRDGIHRPLPGAVRKQWIPWAAWRRRHAKILHRALIAQRQTDA